MPKERQSTENHGAHSQVHKGSSEYGDGGNINYHLGNDDYINEKKDHDRNFLEDAFSVGKGLDESDIGKVAYGNSVSEESGPEDEDGTFTDDELVDQEGRESFPASDPPGHFSKSKVDKEQHP